MPLKSYGDFINKLIYEVFTTFFIGVCLNEIHFSEILLLL